MHHDDSSMPTTPNEPGAQNPCACYRRYVFWATKCPNRPVVLLPVTPLLLCYRNETDCVFFSRCWNDRRERAPTRCKAFCLSRLSAADWRRLSRARARACCLRCLSASSFFLAGAPLQDCIFPRRHLGCCSFFGSL